MLRRACGAVFEEAELARCLVQGSRSSDTHLASFLCELADRAEAQIGQLRKVIASISDLIEPSHLETTTVNLSPKDVDVAYDVPVPKGTPRPGDSRGPSERSGYWGNIDRPRPPRIVGSDLDKLI